jgi:hypothetical protein
LRQRKRKAGQTALEAAREYEAKPATKAKRAAQAAKPASRKRKREHNSLATTKYNSIHREGCVEAMRMLANGPR